MANRAWVLLIPFGVLLFLLFQPDEKKGDVHTLTETGEAYVVETQFRDAPLIDTVKPSPDVTITFGEHDNRAVIKTIEYAKQRYSKGDVERIMRERLAECRRCRV